MSKNSKKKEKKPVHYADFMNDLGGHFSNDQMEAHFLESIAPQRPPEDIEVNVGERVKRVREGLDLSIGDVAQRTGMNESLIRRIEKGETAPPLGDVIKLSKALNMKMGYLISGEENQPFSIVRKNDRKVISRYDSKKSKQYGYEYISLAPHKKDRHMEPFLVTLSPSRTEEERSSHDGQEFIYVLKGGVEIRLGDEIHYLDPGDTIYYDSTVPHLVKCRGEEETEIVAVLYTE
jgi:transcriptional regulator with XRE-family HTH domain